MNLKNLFKKEPQEDQKVKGLSEILTREKELKFWKEYAELIVSKYRDIYLKSPLYQQELKVIKEFIEPEKGQKWLDIGCGALPMAELIWQTSKGEVELWAGDIYLFPAEKRLKEIGNPPIKLKYIDLTKKLSFPDNYFDGIVISKVLAYIPEFQGQKGKEALKGIFQEMFRILKPGGILIWSCSRKKTSRLVGVLSGLGYLLNPYQWIKQKCFLPLAVVKMLKFFNPVIEKLKKGTYHSFSPKEYEDLLISIGFKNPEWRLSFGRQIFVNKVIKPL